MPTALLSVSLCIKKCQLPYFLCSNYKDSTDIDNLKESCSVTDQQMTVVPSKFQFCREGRVRHTLREVEILLILSASGVTRNLGAPGQNIQAGPSPFIPLSFPCQSL